MTVKVIAKKQLGRGLNSFYLDVAFEVGTGITVLEGESGSGKTTTLRIIAGILRPDQGMVNVCGQVYFDSARAIELSIRERRVGFVFQDYALFPHLSAIQNVAYGLKGGSRKEKLEKASDLLATFRVEHLNDRLPQEMSGGEQQRVALARALAPEPSIVLLDEPLSAVDVETRAKLLDEIEAAQARAGVPFIYVTHNRSEALRLGNDRISLNRGTLVRNPVRE